MFTVANKLNELRDACKNAGIKATGKKPELIERLNYHAVIRAEVEAAETLLAAEAAEKLLASDADEEDEDAIVQITINRTAGEEVDPGEEDNDGAEEDELVANGNEFDQSISKTRSTVQTKKHWSSHSIEHNYVASDDKRRYGLKDVIKAEIAAFYKAGVRKASRLLTALRKEMFLSKK